MRNPVAGYLFFQQIVEVIVSGIHLRGFDRIGDFGGQLAQPIGATLQSAQSLQLRIHLR
jgi:hypothetical protein